MILPITLTIAAAATLLNIWLAIRTARVRVATKVHVGPGGSPLLETKMRAHANFVEYTPFFLILMGLIELAHGTTLWLWVVGILYILARIAHAFGLERPGSNLLRGFGIIVTLLTLFVLSIYALSIPYLTPTSPVTTVVGQG